jgi:hypothetical protein
MKGYMGPETSKDMFVGISSIRHSYSEIMQHMCEWVGVVLCPEYPAKLPSDDTLRAMWELLGLDTEVVDQLVYHKLIFIGSQLKVSAEALGYDNDRLDDIVGLLTAVMRFVKFSDSRFLTVGPACRALVSSSLLGLQHLIGWLRKVKKVSDYYIHGFSRLSPDVWQVVLVAALGSGVAEGLMAELLEDDRVLFRFQELKDIVKIEMEAVTLISQEVLELLCMVSCGGSLPWNCIPEPFTAVASLQPTLTK